MDEQTPQRDQPAIAVSANVLVLALVAVVFFSIGVLIGAVFLGRPVGVDARTIDRIIRDALLELDMPMKADRFALVDNDPYLGDEDAPVVIVEFSAYGCPYCKKHYDETLKGILENYGDSVRYVYRDMPTVNPEVSFPAAMAAECANLQGQFWPYHDALFEQQQRLGTELFVEIAADLGLDMAAFQECLDTSATYEEVNGDFFDGTVNGVTSTPNFFINGELYTGAQPYAFFENIINRELMKAGAQP
jgi:protein-disulfide isomerase